MNHADLLGLIEAGVAPRPGEWADLGSGEGAFTLALAELLGPGGRIHSVDRDRRALEHQRVAMLARFPETSVSYLPADFGAPLPLPPLDGVVMANSLHFFRRKEGVLELVRRYLKPGGRLVLVEYDADHGNPWVPHPVSYAAWEQISAQAGFEGTRLLKRIPSRFLGAIYSALSRRPAVGIRPPPASRGEAQERGL
jgi:ubiquinone/menaquinone biosynthesis C-methylase UbiE